MELAFDKVILNKKATNKQVLQMLSIAPLLEIKAKPIVDIEPVAIDVKTDPEYTTTTKPTTQEELKFADKTITPDTAKDEVKTDQIIEVETVKDDYDYYSVIKSKENLYRLKSTLQDANEKWEKIVKEFEKSNIIDTDYITVVKQQLNDAGFTKKIFDKSSFKIEDYRMLNYVFAKYNTLLKETDTKANPITVDSTRQATEKSNINVARAAATLAVGDAVKSLTDDYIQPIDNVLENYFGRFADEIDFSNKEIDNQKSIKFLLFEYYKKYVKLTDYKTNVVNSYINVLDDNLADTEIRTEYFEIFEIYFNKIMAPNKSIIENLDLDFSLYDNDYWVSYKNNFANSCNQIAWEIVKKSTDKVLIKKAIKWSETSVEIEKNTHYYWDTLARLYYLNGQKDKAILTQQKAIDLGKDSENGVEYNDVLEQMKNGTYTLPKKD